MSVPLPDEAERERAAGTFDRNVVVTAGAGTGKTTLLVDRLVRLLLRSPEPLKITEIVALTFTNKAAQEMKARLRERLLAYAAVRLDEEPAGAGEARQQEELRGLMARYGLKKDEVDARAGEALRQMEKSEIGTIHSFAASLLRLYPVEAGLDPLFREDEGPRFERHFQAAWEDWLGRELSRRGARKGAWKRALGRVSLEEVRRLAFGLCSENVSVRQLHRLFREPPAGGPLEDWLESLRRSAVDLAARHPEGRKIERAVQAARAVIERFLKEERIPPGAMDEEGDLLASGLAPVKGWDEEEVEEARRLQRVAGRLLSVDADLLRLLAELLVPFVESCRREFLAGGYVSFDGLLVRARDLVRDHPEVREELKGRFKTVLIDEFQDTDPVQYEILLYLAERPGRGARDWRDVELAPGKVFVVGDPKQSIYAFRRADIEAYLRVVREKIEAQGGIHCKLTVNFRSHAGILGAVNGVFSGLIRHREGLQPEYVPIGAVPEGDPHPDPEFLPFRKVQVRRVVGAGEGLNAAEARRLEAEALARWLSEEVLDRAVVRDAAGRPLTVQPRHVAVLLRKLTHVDDYLRPLRSRGIPYVVEGEKHFYAMQEVVDAVNLLRAVDNPHDTLALVGLLRSPLGGLTDREVYELGRRRLLDYRLVSRPERAGELAAAPPVRPLYETLERLHRRVRGLPAGEAVARVFEETPVAVLAAQSLHGEQAVANLEKLHRVAQEMGEEGEATFKEIIARLERSVALLREEGEGALAEEAVNAVKVLSVHRAKGLEFPVVVLAGCHAGIDQRDTDQTAVFQDWSTGLAGLRAGDAWDLPWVYLSEKTRLREQEETKRVFYVAMTRAREHLLLSCAGGGSDRRSFLKMLDAASGGLASTGASGMIPFGDGRAELEVVTQALHPPEKARPPGREEAAPVDWAGHEAAWRRRGDLHREIVSRPFFLTPTRLQEAEARRTPARPSTGGGAAPVAAAFVGQLAHRFLQAWDFSEAPERWPGALEVFLAGHRKKGAAVTVEAELREIFSAFFSSPSYRELAGARILGREVPLLLPWEGRVMDGALDVLYERSGRLYVADYKTDRLRPDELSGAAEEYRHQARVYTEAVRKGLGRDVAAFKLIFLRLGLAVEVPQSSWAP